MSQPEPGYYTRIPREPMWICAKNGDFPDRWLQNPDDICELWYYKEGYTYIARLRLIQLDHRLFAIFSLSSTARYHRLAEHDFGLLASDRDPISYSTEQKEWAEPYFLSSMDLLTRQLKTL